ncbi:uncharacterized protein L969DRAFT_96404 [Mixia osmundae IAM 14324]|uniref:GATA-type domain-containing protein n=1 Tax=Mixia osmundae (strain CBS 9802 / IAM 14324 / JCM 22182 / KY 12970) TaxID=764103 RepID=G7DWG2_MIXOS|nr:uncharacterized protein L969DRAFT_96404 [Mixia osmundae IAM 14324]KEI37324.1 hypothetical protein L969DRAFT_96404 [Mixia osmundae IAM 14324]GAA94922.1 hypothetical protein E5Q_01577 [Mixia osmundae IAM 14324]
MGLRGSPQASDGSERRRMPIKVLYTLNFANQSRGNDQNDGNDRVPHRGSDSSSRKRSSQQEYIARWQGGVEVQIRSHVAPLPNTSASGQSDVQLGKRRDFGEVPLKTCLGAICMSRPDLILDQNKDFQVSSLDAYESHLRSREGSVSQSYGHSRQMPDSPGPSGSTRTRTSTNALHLSPSRRPEEGLLEGKGMLSWCLEEINVNSATTVIGRVVVSEAATGREHDVLVTRSPAHSKPATKRLRMTKETMKEEWQLADEDTDGLVETLEVYLQLTERPKISQSQFFSSLSAFGRGKKTASSSSGPFGDVSAHTAPSPNMSAFGDSQSRTSKTTPSDSTGKAHSPLVPQSEPVGPRTVQEDTLPVAQSVGGDPVKKRRGRPPGAKNKVQDTAIVAARRTSTATETLVMASDMLAELDPNAFAAFPTSTTPAELQDDCDDSAASPADTASGRKKQVRLYNSQGCSNCGVKKSCTWRRRRNGNDEVRLCNTCGVFFNTKGFHRPVTKAYKPTKVLTQGQDALGKEADDQKFVTLSPTHPESRKSRSSPRQVSRKRAHSLPASAPPSPEKEQSAKVDAAVNIIQPSPGTAALYSLLAGAGMDIQAESRSERQQRQSSLPISGEPDWSTFFSAPDQIDSATSLAPDSPSLTPHKLAKLSNSVKRITDIPDVAANLFTQVEDRPTPAESATPHSTTNEWQPFQPSQTHKRQISGVEGSEFDFELPQISVSQRRLAHVRSRQSSDFDMSSLPPSSPPVLPAHLLLPSDINEGISPLSEASCIDTVADQTITHFEQTTRIMSVESKDRNTWSEDTISALAGNLGLEQQQHDVEALLRASPNDLNFLDLIDTFLKEEPPVQRTVAAGVQ